MRAIAAAVTIFYTITNYAQSPAVVEIGPADGENIAEIFSGLSARHTTFNPVTGTVIQTTTKYSSPNEGLIVRCVTRYVYSATTRCTLQFEAAKSSAQLKIFRLGEKMVHAVFTAPDEVRELSKKVRPIYTAAERAGAPILQIICFPSECRLDAYTN